MLSINIRVSSYIQKEFENKRVENGIHANHPKVGVTVAVLALDEIDFNRTVFFFFFFYRIATDFYINKKSVHKGDV